MAIVSLLDSNNCMVAYNDECIFGYGGEANIYEIMSNRNYLLKIYKNPLAAKNKKNKILYMISKSADFVNDKTVSWPLSAVYENKNGEKGEFLGYVMAKLEKNASLRDYLSVAGRKRTGLAVLDLYGKLHFSLRIAYIFRRLHSKGISGFDGNSDNYIIARTKDGRDIKFAIIDCDSFRIDNYAGDSWHLEFPAPEYYLANVNDKNIVVNADGDRFIFALYAFAILMDGQNPFSAILKPGFDSNVYIKGTDVCNKRMAKGIYPYGKDRKAFNYTVGSVDYNEMVPEPLKKLFEQVFENPMDIAGRPTIQNWIDTIEGVLKSDIPNVVPASNKLTYNMRGKINPIVLMIDVTVSMFNETKAWIPVINAVQEMMRVFKQMDSEDNSFNLASVDICIMTFAGATVRTLTDFTQLNETIINNYQRTWLDDEKDIIYENTNISNAVNTAINKVNNYIAECDNKGENIHRPKVILFTDGIPAADDDILKSSAYDTNNYFYKWVNTNRTEMEFITIALGELRDVAEKEKQEFILNNIADSGEVLTFRNDDDMNNKLREFMQWVSYSTLFRR